MPRGQRLAQLDEVAGTDIGRAAIRPAIGGGEMAVLHAKTLCLSIHHDRPARHAARRALCQHYRGIVGGNRGDGAQQDIERHAIPCLQAQAGALAVPVLECSLRHSERLFGFQLALGDQFEGDIGGHHLGDRGRDEAELGLASVQHLIRSRIEHQTDRNRSKRARLGDARPRFAVGVNAVRHCQQQQREQYVSSGQQSPHPGLPGAREQYALSARFAPERPYIQRCGPLPAPLRPAPDWRTGP